MSDTIGTVMDRIDAPGYVRAERIQRKRDAQLGETLYDEYIAHTPKEDALRTIRQCSCITHYLSRMANGWVCPDHGVYFGAAIVAIDELADELAVEVPKEDVEAAFEGDIRHDSLEVLPVVEEQARSDHFRDFFIDLTGWQNRSLEQLETTDFGQLKKIARGKGGSAGQANLAMVKRDLEREEIDLMKTWGFMIQLLDDFLDKTHDEKNGINTLFTIGRWSHEDLKLAIDDVAWRTEMLWGESRAHSRFFRICRWLRQAGRIIHRTPLTPRDVFPWYV